ncbi:MAG: glycosyltransferase family 4 protein [Gammaproteobacteria bacterium]|nr:glycosyltransferase family 4 protein [Gammaproteobacteria bacterium]MBU1446736.1 glycosyltransferase family 4 protein [Gammaproteobacteria bacterium]
MKIIHIVRRYGPVGGMERYVWETTRELAKLGHQVQVICEQCMTEKPQGIAVHELGRMAYRPRWLYYWRFSRRVDAWLQANPQPGWLIHSNERVGVHDVTTFHGPPFASVRDKPWWKKVSIRVAAQLWLERRELRVAKAIVPNSEIIAKQLAHYYPEYAHKLTAPIVPGVVPGVMRTQHGVPEDGGIIGFVGREWQRKGLPLAVEIVARLRQKRPKLELWVVGPEESEISHLFKDWQGGYRLLGWRTDSAHFEKIDVLLHPAKAEPYGMVISEAMAARVPVVVSDACGAAAQVGSEMGAVIALAAPMSDWIAAVVAQLDRAEAPPTFARGWGVVAQEYETIYSDLT